MEIAYDPAKDAMNRQKHKVSLELATAIDLNASVVLSDDRRDYGEARFRAYGLIDGRLHMLAFTIRGTAVRAISLRKANKKEVRRYG